MAFERLGFDVASLSNMSPEEQFDTLARCVFYHQSDGTTRRRR